MGTHCQTATWSSSVGRQNLGAVNSFWSNTGGGGGGGRRAGGGQLQTKNITGGLAYNI